MRVIDGKLRGRRLSAPPGQATRPTSDRVREALFSMLGDPSGARVLDLYAGTGALGIEALSRGAERAVFVESRRPALTVLKANLSSLGLLECSTVVGVPVERAAPMLLAHAPFDLVLCDPPWADLPRAASALSRVCSTVGLVSGARVVLEHNAADEPELDEKADLMLVTRRAWGDTAVSVFTFTKG